MPANSSPNLMSADTRVISVTYWAVNNTTKFMEAIDEFQNAMKEKEGDIREYWFSTIGSGPLERWATLEIDKGYWFSSIVSGPDNFSYMTVLPFRNHAQMDEVGSGIWDVLESEGGKRHSDETNNPYRVFIDKAWSYVFTWVEGPSRGNAGLTAIK